MPLSIEELRKKLLQRVEAQPHEFSTRTLHILEQPLPPGSKLQIGPHRYEVPGEVFLVVIDEAPGAFWTHPVRYELHDVATREVRVIQEQYPIEMPEIRAELVPLHIPDLPWLKPKGGEDLPRDGPFDLAAIERQLAHISFGLPLAQSSHRHALFFAGMDNMPHFHTDFVIMRDVLISRYGYDPTNIVIVMGDGSGYPDLPVDYAGDHAGLDAALDAFALGGVHALGAGDTLFLYTFNHGGADGAGAYLCLPGWAKYYDYELRAKLDNIQCGQLIVAMNQCHSGGFINDVTATSGPAEVAIMTACREDQSAYPTVGGGDHGYLSVALAAALNWAFPAGVTATLPGYSAGAITAQDTNGDGLVSAEEAWHYVQSMMTTYHDPTIRGIETPQWGTSEAGVGALLYWGLPDLLVHDGVPWWESPDVYLHDPAVLPDDTTAVAGNPANWGDYYHPDTVNRIVARVHNTGCAPARNVTVEFRTMSFGSGGGITLVGTAAIACIDPGQHAFAYADWNFSSALIHRCTMVRATCAGDPAAPFASNIEVDDNQAQRNLDPLFAGDGAHASAVQIVKRTFTIANPGPLPAVFAVQPGKGWVRSRLIRPILPAPGELSPIMLGPREQRQLTVQFEIDPKVKLGEKARFPLEIRSGTPRSRVVGGVTFTIEVAEGDLEGRIVNRVGMLPRPGTVTIENIKQPDYHYTAAVDLVGRFSFRQIVPGPYRIRAECGGLKASGSVFVAPNRVTTKILTLAAPGPIVRPPVRLHEEVELESLEVSR